MLRRFLFETKLGDWLLSIFEYLTGLAVVPVEELLSR